MENTIYEKLGAEKLQQMVDTFYELVVEHPTLQPLFKTDMELVRKKQLAFLTQFLGGPLLYNETYGHPMMRMRHLPHAITEEAALAWLLCMKSAINTLEIDADFKETLFNCFPKVAAHMVNR